MKKKSLIHWWRIHGSKILFFLILLSIFISKVILGFFIIMMLTVPCGIKKVNTCLPIWYLRQVYFLIIGLLLMFS